MTLDQAAAHTELLDLVSVRFRDYVDYVLTRTEKWQQHGLCAQPDRVSNYSLQALPASRTERAHIAQQLCAGCPVFTECGVFALATTAPDCIVSGVPYGGHPAQRRRIIETLGLTADQAQYLRKVKAPSVHSG